jgi:outer membrane lipoprotein-sorting protein
MSMPEPRGATAGAPPRAARPTARSRRWARWLAAGALALQLAAPAGAFDLDQLMGRLARVKSAEATFVERRTVFQLDQTLESSGRLSYAAPDTFVRETLKPRHDKLAVVGNQLTMSQGDRSRTVALDATPEAQVMIEAIRGTLTGNRPLLERHFETRLDGTPERWDLALVPRDARLRGQVAQLHVAGRQAEIREVRVTMADGDRSVMLIESASGPAR